MLCVYNGSQPHEGRKSTDTHDQNDCSATHEITVEALVDNPLGSVDIKCCQYVIQEQNLRWRVDGTSQGNASLIDNDVRSLETFLDVRTFCPPL